MLLKKGSLDNIKVEDISHFWPTKIQLKYLDIFHVVTFARWHTFSLSDNPFIHASGPDILKYEQAIGLHKALYVLKVSGKLDVFLSLRSEYILSHSQ